MRGLAGCCPASLGSWKGGEEESCHSAIPCGFLKAIFQTPFRVSFGDGCGSCQGLSPGHRWALFPHPGEARGSNRHHPLLPTHSPPAVELSETPNPPSAPDTLPHTPGFGARLLRRAEQRFTSLPGALVSPGSLSSCGQGDFYHQIPLFWHFIL